MSIAARAKKTDVSRNGNIMGSFFPYIMESITGIPHILSTTLDGIAAAKGVKSNRTFYENITDIIIPFKNSA